MRPSFKRVMLVAPPGRCTPEGSYQAVPPEGVARLAAWLRQQGLEVHAVDACIEGYDVRAIEGKTVRYGLPVDQVAVKIAERSPDIIGLSCLFTCIEPDVIQIARACKALLPQVPVVLGGAHAGLNAASLLAKEPAVDFVALSEGEQTMASLISCLRDGRNPNELEGIAWRKNDLSIQARPLKRLLDLDQLPPPAWDLFPLEAYAKANAPHGGVGRKKRYLPTTWSRGCVNACSYCLTPSVWGPGNHRKRLVSSILDEAKRLEQDFDIEELHVEDDCLLADKAWLHAILDAIAKECSDLRLELPNGLDVIDLDRATAVKLARAGTIRLSLSFDAGESDNSLRWVGKRVPLERGREAIAMLHDGGISLIGYFMLGFPGQTIDDMRSTVDYALSLDLDEMCLFIVTPFPGTPLHTFCAREGLLVTPHDLRDFRFSTGHIRTKEFGPEDSERLRHEGWLEFRNSKKAIQNPGSSGEGCTPH